MVKPKILITYGDGMVRTNEIDPKTGFSTEVDNYPSDTPYSDALADYEFLKISGFDVELAEESVNSV